MATSTAGQPKKQGIFSNMANPVIRKLEKQGEFASDNVASYKGIVSKTAFFLLVTVAGTILSFILHNILLNSGAGTVHHFHDNESKIIDLTISTAEIGILAAVLIVSIIVPFLAWLIKSTIPVTGTIYSACQGMLIGYITIALLPEYRFISLLAMIITLSLVGAMLFVFAKRIITVTQRFRGVVTAIFFGIVISGIIYFILNLIPGIRNSGLFSGINSTLNHPVVSVGISIIFVILASLFMLVDFDTIQRCVENRLDKKYEWMAAWGLAYTILYIYFKILRILITIFGNSRGKE